MKNKIYCFKPSNTQLILVGLLIILFASIQSCKKERLNDSFFNPVTENFLSIPSGSDPDIHLITENIRTQIQKKNFVPDFLQFHGMPLWDKAIKIKSKNGDITFYIPTRKKDDNEITCFFVAIKRGNRFYYEMHRRTAMVSGDYEYTRVGIDKKNIQKILSYFDFTILNRLDTIEIKDKLLENANGNAPSKGSINNENEPTPNNFIQVCWTVLYEVPCGENNGSTTVWIKLKCYNSMTMCVILHGDDGGGGGLPPDPGPGPGGGGGGTGGGCNGNLWYSENPLPPNPCGDGGPPPIPWQDSIPLIDSIVLKLLHDDNMFMKSRRDSVWNEAYTNNWEFRFDIAMKSNGQREIVGIRTDSAENYCEPDKHARSGKAIIAHYHTHQDPLPKDRHPHDPQDVLVGNSYNKQTFFFRAYVDCGDTLYAVVNENKQKMQQFLNAHMLQAINDSQEWEHLINSLKRREEGLNLLKNLLGNSTITGIGFYKSNNVEKTNFEKIN